MRHRMGGGQMFSKAAAQDILIPILTGTGPWRLHMGDSRQPAEGSRLTQCLP